jgi:drug/metabolite transporter (DMT)-like permease
VNHLVSQHTFAAMKWTLQNRYLQWSTMAILALIWGSSFILMKRGLEYYSNFEVASLRILFASVVMLPLGLRYFRKVQSKHYLPIFWVGFFGNFLPAYLFTTAQTVLPSSLTGMLNSMVPIFTLIMGVILFKSKTKQKSIFGVALGFIGAIGLVVSQSGFSFGSNLSYYPLLIVIATLCYASSVNVIKYYLGNVSPLAITSIAFMFIGPFSMVYLLFNSTQFLQTFTVDAIQPLTYIAVLGIVGTAMAVLLFNALIKETTAIFASSVTYLIPVVALGWGLVDGEQITSMQVAFMVLLLGGVYLAKR